MSADVKEIMCSYTIEKIVAEKGMDEDLYEWVDRKAKSACDRKKDIYVDGDSVPLDKKDVSEIILRWIEDKNSGERIIFRLGAAALSFAERGDMSNARMVWSFASRLNALGKKAFTDRLESGCLWNADKKRGEK